MSHVTPSVSAQTPEIAVIPVPVAREVGLRRARRRWLVVGVGAVVLMVVVRGFLVQSFSIPSGSMEPTLEPGDRILVNQVAIGSMLRRGDLVVFDGTRTFAARDAARSDPSDYVKRVVGLPGDHVVCCDAGGMLTVNDVSVIEPYVYAGDKPSDLTFDVKVPAGRVWLMGDHRSDSADSRAHLGDPGGGMVRLDDVIGRAAMVYWPPSRFGLLTAPAALAGIPADSTGESHR